MGNTQSIQETQEEETHCMKITAPPANEKTLASFVNHPLSAAAAGFTFGYGLSLNQCPSSTFLRMIHLQSGAGFGCFGLGTYMLLRSMDQEDHAGRAACLATSGTLLSMNWHMSNDLFVHPAKETPSLVNPAVVVKRGLGRGLTVMGMYGAVWTLMRMYDWNESAQ